MTAAHTTHTKHGLAAMSVRDPPSPDDGQRILTDRLWPRGVSKEKAQIGEWRKDLAPTKELRQWFGHDPKRWTEFRKRYHHELVERDQLGALRELCDRSRRERITFVYDAHDHEHNEAVALLEFAHKL
jgi:uncharacterized protein YeaO (DUF488 family)